MFLKRVFTVHCRYSFHGTSCTMFSLGKKRQCNCSGRSFCQVNIIHFFLYFDNLNSFRIWFTIHNYFIIHICHNITNVPQQQKRLCTMFPLWIIFHIIFHEESCFFPMKAVNSILAKCTLIILLPKDYRGNIDCQSKEIP